MSSGFQVYYTRFDAAFFNLPTGVQVAFEAKIDEMGARLDAFSHHRLKDTNRYRLRVADYSVIYRLELNPGVIHPLAIGHRREIYRNL